MEEIEQQPKGFGVEINALFNLWDEFAPLLTEGVTKASGNILKPFLHFPAGTNVHDIMDWFLEQNPYFAIQPSYKPGGKQEFKVINNPAKPEKP